MSNEMNNLDFIDSIGMTEEIASEEVTESEEIIDEIDNDVSTQHTEVETLEEDDTKDTEPTVLQGLQKQIEVMEKRINDKDSYIEELRKNSKQQEVEGNEEAEEDFWDNPESKVQKLEQQLQMQQMQIQETYFANTVDDYWKTVNPQDLKEAVSMDSEFGDKFNNSKEPYKIAYEHLKGLKATKQSKNDELRDTIRKELMEEMGVKTVQKSVPPSTSSMSSGSKANAPTEDGFSSIFGG